MIQRRDEQVGVGGFGGIDVSYSPRRRYAMAGHFRI